MSGSSGPAGSTSYLDQRPPERLVQHRTSLADQPTFMESQIRHRRSQSGGDQSSSDFELHQHNQHLGISKPHELHRPDSVITTSSIVSSSDNNSQAGDSDTTNSLSNNIYTMSGLYGVRQRTPSTSKDTSQIPAATSSNDHKVRSDANHASSVTKSSTSLASGSGGDFRQVGHLVEVHHRRQTSHPGHFEQLQGCENANKWHQSNTKQLTHPQKPVDVITVHHPSLPNRPGLTNVLGHRRCNSYGHHKALTATCSLGGGGSNGGHFAHGIHRRAGSSVLETLQTLACKGDHEAREKDSIAQFLENLKKEQQEKYEKQELHEMQDELEDLRDCGVGAFRPKLMQGLASIKVFVFLLSMLVTLQQALSSGYLNSVITTIEKRYEIPSSISGIIASMYEIGNVGTVIFVSYLGSRRHIPSWIGMGVLVMGIGSITFSLPHFLSENYMVHSDSNASSDNICKVSNSLKLTPPKSPEEELLDQLPGLDKIKSLTEGLSSPPLGPHNNIHREENCIESANESSTMPIFIFMVAQLLLGCGGSPLFTLGTTYIDNHVKRDDSSMYIGIMYSMCAFGPVCGFLLGAYLLSHYVDTFSMDLTTLLIDSGDRHWIGMWWGGFLICGIGLVIIAIPFFFFPKELKKEKVKVYIDEKYHHATDPSIRPKHKEYVDHPDAVKEHEQEAKDYGKDIKDIPRSTWKLLTNKIYMITCLGACMELIIVSGFIVFLPKYLETQFNQSKSMASMFTGGIAIPGACIGIFLGGYILKRLQLRPKGAVQLVIFFNFLCLGCYGLLFLFGCDNIKMAGTTQPYFNNNNDEPFKVNLTASCNFGCECDMNDVQLVCGANGLTYFSPCHAGCKGLGDSNTNFTDCACVYNSNRPEVANPLQGGLDEFAEVTMVPVATSGPCYSHCQMILPFMVLLFFMTLVVAVTQMPVLMVVLRSVEEEEKAFALGIQFVIFRLFGYIPSPILFGNVIDSTCMLWKSTCDGEAGGRCLMYDIEMFRYKYVGVCCGIKILSVIIFLIDWWLIRSRQNAEKKENALTVGEVVNSIISLDKLFEPDGPLWSHHPDAEEPVHHSTHASPHTSIRRLSTEVVHTPKSQRFGESD